jgi:hypothetical protein
MSSRSDRASWHSPPEPDWREQPDTIAAHTFGFSLRGPFSREFLPSAIRPDCTRVLPPASTPMAGASGRCGDAGPAHPLRPSSRSSARIGGGVPGPEGVPARRRDHAARWTPVRGSFRSSSPGPLSCPGVALVASSTEQNRGAVRWHRFFCSSSHGQPAHCSFTCCPSIFLLMAIIRQTAAGTISLRVLMYIRVSPPAGTDTMRAY